MPVLEERVESSLIAAEFQAIAGSGKISPNTTLYWLIEKDCGVKPGNARKIVEGRARTGPKPMYNALRRLHERLINHEDIRDSISKLVGDIESLGIFTNRSAFAEFIDQRLRPEHPDLMANIRNFLFYHQHKFTAPWHYSLVSLLDGIKSGKVQVDRKYLRWDFPTYQGLLRFAYLSLRRDYGMTRHQALGELSSLLRLSPKTLLSHHMYGKTPIRGSRLRLSQFQNKLVDYIKGKILITIDLTKGDYSLLNKRELGGNLRAYPERNKVLMLLPNYEDHDLMPSEPVGAASYLRKQKYQVVFVFGSNAIEKRILGYKIK